MPNFTLEDAQREAYAAAPTDTVLVDTLEFVHPSFSQPLRVVNDRQSLTATLEPDAPVNAGEDVTFAAFAFRLEPPEVGDGAAAELTITIDNVSTEIGRYMAAATLGNEPVRVIYRACIVKENEVELGARWEMSLVRAKANNFSVEATASFGDVINAAFPTEDYNATDFPGLAQ